MVAYSFKERFCQPIVDRTKRQTIRAIGKRRHARPGDDVQIYTAMRTTKCRKVIPDTTCEEIVPVRFDITDPRAPVLFVDGRLQSGARRLDAFARADGFRNFGDMVAFWLEEHGAIDFNGVLIKWRDK